MRTVTTKYHTDGQSEFQGHENTNLSQCYTCWSLHRHKIGPRVLLQYYQADIVFNINIQRLDIHGFHKIMQNIFKTLVVSQTQEGSF